MRRLPEPHGLLRNGRGCSAMLLEIFTFVLFSAGRRTPAVADQPRVPTGGAGVPCARCRCSFHRGSPSSLFVELAPEAVTLDNLLVCYDALFSLCSKRGDRAGAKRRHNSVQAERALSGADVRGGAAARRANSERAVYR